MIEDRGAVGHRWSVNGALTGTMEVWLEPSLDGVILNYFLHAEPAGAAAWQLAKMNLAKLTPPAQGGGQEDVLRAEAEAGGIAAGRDAPAGLILGQTQRRRVDFHSIECDPMQGNNYVADKTAQTIYIDADPSTVMDVIADIGSYPDWVAEYKETEVLEADDEGYPKTARLVLDAAVLKDTMVLEYDWPADRGSVTWKLVSSSLLQVAGRRIPTWRPRDLAPMSPMNSRSTWSFR